MSILIRGMKMPKDCIKCPFCLLADGHWKCLADGSFADFGGTCRPPKCPLIEVQTPHGRLIDADALADDFRGHIALYDSCPFSQLSFTDKARRGELQASLAEVINAPTIIEAEEGANNENL